MKSKLTLKKIFILQLILVIVSVLYLVNFENTRQRYHRDFTENGVKNIFEDTSHCTQPNKNIILDRALQRTIDEVSPNGLFLASEFSRDTIHLFILDETKWNWMLNSQKDRLLRQIYNRLKAQKGSDVVIELSKCSKFQDYSRTIWAGHIQMNDNDLFVSFDPIFFGAAAIRGIIVELFIILNVLLMITLVAYSLIKKRRKSKYR